MNTKKRNFHVCAHRLSVAGTMNTQKSLYKVLPWKYMIKFKFLRSSLSRFTQLSLSYRRHRSQVDIKNFFLLQGHFLFIFMLLCVVVKKVTGRRMLMNYELPALSTGELDTMKSIFSVLLLLLWKGNRAKFYFNPHYGKFRIVL